MKTEIYYDEPFFAAGSKKEGNVKAFILSELKINVPFYSRELNKKDDPRGWYFREVLLRSLKGVSTCLYQLYFNEWPVWGNAVTIIFENEKEGVLSALVNYDEKLQEGKIKIKAVAVKTDSINEALLKKELAIDRNILRLKALKQDLSDYKPSIIINATMPVIYRYDPQERQHVHDKKKSSTDVNNIGIFRELPQLKIPDVNAAIKEGKYYSCTEVLFSTVVPWGKLNWRAILDNENLSVLYLRVLTDNLGGYVFSDDPTATTGDPAILPTSALAVLNSVREPKAIPGLVPPSPLYSLTGNYVTLAELTLPANTYPTSANNFNYNVTSEEFAAVNAYVHNDNLFRLVEEMGFDMGVYFDGTTFPVPVDHHGSFNCVNACAPGNTAGDGSGGFHYGLVQSGTTIGIAVSKRIVYHEFGHAILWDNVHSPNLGFAHSVGDSLAAVLMDPRSKAPDRFMTFPWLTLANPGIDRRHDRTVAGGWGWGSANDDGGYGSEQILSSSHFRLYQALGGDSKDLCRREWAARYTAYLIFFGVGLLTPITNSPNPESWSGTLQLADRNTVDFEGLIGRCIHKVIRWAFEKQNAYGGLPPAVDLFINDGRMGEYQYDGDIYNSPDIWNRHQPDNGVNNQIPIPGQINYAYVIVRNRGTQNSTTRTTIKGFKTSPGCCGDSIDKLCWPIDFMPLQTPEISITTIEGLGYEVIGPFKWVPCSKKDMLLFSASCKADLSNIDNIRTGYSVDLKKLVRFDNNIAIRRNCYENCCF